MKDAKRRASARHFPVQQWVDYIRGLGTDQDRQRMALHLDSGCTHCRLTVELFSRIAKVTRLDADCKEVDGAVNAAIELAQKD